MQPHNLIIQLLQSSGAAFQELEHAPMYTSAQEKEMTGLDSEQGAKSLLLKTKAEFVLIVIPGNKRLDMKKAKKLLHSKDLRFATTNEVNTVMGCEVGACYPIGIVAGIRTIFDPTLEKHDKVAFNPALQTKTIVMKYQDLFALAQPELMSIVE
jgi:Ala-tRNA(Pro) deacylase